MSADAIKISLLDGPTSVYDELRVEAFQWSSQRDGEVSSATSGTRYNVYSGDQRILSNVDARTLLGFLVEKFVWTIYELEGPRK